MDGMNTQPAISGDGRMVAFTTTSGAFSPAKPRGVEGVVVRDMATGAVGLLSQHPRRPALARISALCHLFPVAG